MARLLLKEIKNVVENLKMFPCGTSVVQLSVSD